MGIVKADQALASFVVQGQTVVQTVRTFWRRRNAFDHELDVKPPIRIDKEHLAIEGQQCVKAGVAFLRHFYLCYHILITTGKKRLICSPSGRRAGAQLQREWVADHSSNIEISSPRAAATMR